MRKVRQELQDEQEQAEEQRWQRIRARARALVRSNTLPSTASLPAASAEPLMLNKREQQRSSSMPRSGSPSPMTTRNRSIRAGSVMQPAIASGASWKRASRADNVSNAARDGSASASTSASTSPVRASAQAGGRPPGAERYWERGQQVIDQQHRRQPGEKPAYAAVTREDRLNRCACKLFIATLYPCRDEAQMFLGLLLLRKAQFSVQQLF